MPTLWKLYIVWYAEDPKKLGPSHSLFICVSENPTSIGTTFSLNPDGEGGWKETIDDLTSIGGHRRDPRYLGRILLGNITERDIISMREDWADGATSAAVDGEKGQESRNYCINMVEIMVEGGVLPPEASEQAATVPRDVSASRVV